ncbi:metal-dependent hydrolase [Winogradskyella eckloniae]|uniref:metal-dependent hydrolase n=1 Tax=Winogradskyella eckloniae TaxID=1089306 RepID=UPI00156646E6|nr:metal-dependent hydrolase [Winogradskyella eckloniae]NRD21339.1 metal-dependent hydrolase [Winogradskyella eckloniae]
MASIFGHGFVAYTIAKVVDSTSHRLLVGLAIGSAMLPDIDVLAFSFGIDYHDPLGHRGFTHSILFAIIWSCILAFIFGKSRKLMFAVVLFLSTISHGLLDAMTTGGEGVGFLIPLDHSRYFFPLRPIKVSPIGIENFFSEWGVKVILSELQFIILPCIIVLVVLYVFKKLNFKK